MKQLIRTFINCSRLGTFRYFKILYNEVPFSIDRECREEAGQIRLLLMRSSSSVDYVIHIGKFKDKRHLATALLHEIGHYRDYLTVGRKRIIDQFVRNFGTEEREKQAWKHCFRLADKYNIELDYVAAKKWLGTYKTTYQVLENRIENNKSRRS